MNAIEYVKSFLRRRRGRWMARHASFSAVTLACAVAAILVAGAGAEDALSSGLVWWARLFGALVAAYASLELARVLYAAPNDADVALWVERELPSLRDSLITALEGGPLASTSAEYAMARLRTAQRASATAGHSHGEAARTRLVWSGAVALLMAIAVRVAVGFAVDEGIEAPLQLDAPPEELAEVEVFALPPTRNVAAYVPMFGVVAPGREPAGESSRGGSLDAADILLSSPPGYERAVELYISTQARRSR